MSFSIRQLAALFCSTITVAGTVAPANAFQLQTPHKPAIIKKMPLAPYTPDLLIVMANKGLQNDELQDAMEEVHGTVLGTLGHGDLKCLIVKTEKGQLEETEKKLKKDRKHFSTIGRNYRISACMVPDNARNPEFKQQWHLQTLHCPNVWDRTMGGNAKIAIFDTGCNANNPSLANKTDKGYDACSAVARAIGGGGGLIPGFAVPGATEVVSAIGGAANDLNNDRADNDWQGHGTEVASVAAGNIDAVQGIGVAPYAKIYPVRIANMKSPVDKSHAMTTDLELIAGMIHVMDHPDIRIVNISYNTVGVGFHNAQLHPALHVYFQKYFAERSGLIFMAAGNDGTFDPTPPCYYLNVISGCDNLGKEYDKSNFGPSISFTGPAVNVYCSGKDPIYNASTGTYSWARNPNGTSLACPIVAAEAALILSKEPYLPNVAVLQRMIKSCKNVHGTAGFNMHFGWGLPDSFIGVTGSDHMSTYTAVNGTTASAARGYNGGSSDGSRRSAVVFP